MHFSVFTFICAGKEHNFNKYEDDFITDLNTPYDYESIMHYRPLSFNKDPDIPTITTTIPAFNNIIGQRLDFSALDLERLNRMYECSKLENATTTSYKHGHILCMFEKPIKHKHSILAVLPYRLGFFQVHSSLFWINVPLSRSTFVEWFSMMRMMLTGFRL